MIKIKLETLQKQGRVAKLQPLLVLDILSEKCFLAGGALRTIFGTDERVKDFDLFFTELDFAAEIQNKLLAAGFGNIHACPLGLLYTYKNAEGTVIQLVCEKAYKHSADVLKEFDLTPCCLAFDGKLLYTTFTTVRDIRKKRLQINCVTFPVATFNRIIKYKDKGYSLFTCPRQFVQAVSNTVFELGDMRAYID